MLPAHVDLEVHIAESQLADCRRELVRRHLLQEYEPSGQHFDLAHPAFPPWRTAAQAAFAVAITTAALLIVFASILAMTRA